MIDFPYAVAFLIYKKNDWSSVSIPGWVTPKFYVVQRLELKPCNWLTRSSPIPPRGLQHFNGPLWLRHLWIRQRRRRRRRELLLCFLKAPEGFLLLWKKLQGWAPHTSTPGWPSKGQPAQSRLHFATNLRTPDSSKSVHIFACEMMSKEKILLKSQDFTTIPKMAHSFNSFNCPISPHGGAPYAGVCPSNCPSPLQPRAWAGTSPFQIVLTEENWMKIEIHHAGVPERKWCDTCSVKRPSVPHCI